MTQEKIWILIANSSKAKIFHVVKFPKIEALHAFVHPESRLQNQDLVSSPPGRSFERGGVTRHAYETTDQKQLEAQIFAKDLSNFLNSSHNKKEFSRLYIFANPTFLGILRQELPKSVHDCVFAEVAKDMTDLNNTEIEEHLRKV